MTSWVHRVTYPSTALHYIGNIILQLLLMAATALLMFSVVLFS